MGDVHQLALVSVRAMPEPEDDPPELNVSTCRTERARRDSMRATLLGMAGHHTGLGLAGTLLREHGELARVALRSSGRLFNRREALADAHLARAGVPEGVQTELC